MPNNFRFAFLEVIVWAEILLFALTVLAGAAYEVAVWTNDVALNSAIRDVALDLSEISFLFVLGLSILLLFFRILRSTWRRIFSKWAVDPELKARLEIIAGRVIPRMAPNLRVKFYIGKGVFNAFANGRRIIIGEKLLRDFSDEEVAGIVGHEIAHVVKRDGIKRASSQALAGVFVGILFFLEGKSYDHVILVGMLLGLTLLLAIPLNWRLEYGADYLAARSLGADAVAKSLDRLRGRSYGGVSFTHPPLPWRIRRVRQMSVPP